MLRTSTDLEGGAASGAPVDGASVCADTVSQMNEPPICKIAPKPRHIDLGQENFNLGALILTCEIPNSVIQNAISLCAASSDPKALCDLMVSHPLPLAKCYHSLYSRIVMMFLNPSFVPSVTDAQIQCVLSMTVQGFPNLSIDTPYMKSGKDSIMKMLSALRFIAVKLQHSVGDPEIKIYQDVVDLLVTLPRWQQILIDECITVSRGALINLATNITLKNFNWFMGKLKISTSVELIDKVLRSPSVVGKCLAIWKLLEIHDLIWQSIDWAAFENLVSTLYTIISWLMDKCKMAAQYAKEGWNWVSAKFRRETTEENRFPTAGTNLPENPAEPAAFQMMAAEMLLNEIDHPERNEAARLLIENQREIHERDPEQPALPAPEEVYAALDGVAAAHVEELSQTSLGRQIVDWIKKVFGDVCIFFRDNPLVAGFISLIISMGSALGITVSEFKTSGDKKSFFKKVSNASKDMYYLQRGKESFWSSVKDFFTIAKEAAGICDEPEVVAFKETLSTLMDSSEVMVTECQSSPGHFVNDPIKFHAFRREIDSIRKQYREVIKFSPTVNLQSLNPIWQQLNKNYNTLLGMWNRHMTATGMRPKPVVIWLYGKTKLGKSEFANWLIDEYNKQTGKAWQTFTISKGPDFWNGFSQQQVIKIDDFNSFTGPEGCLDALAVMNLATCADYNPSIAALDDKLIRATPSLIVICSNFPTVPMNCGINDMQAFEGRRDMLLKVEWPEHMRCDVDADCEHIKERDRKNADIMSDFSHLRFVAKRPLVNARDEEAVVDTMASASTIKVVVNGQLVDQVYRPNEIIQVLQEKIAESERRHLAALKRREAHLQPPENALLQATGELTDWERYPNLLLIGAPGIGKSKVLESIKLKKNAEEILYITSLSDFESFAAGGFVSAKKIVIVEDTTTIYRSPKFIEFMLKFKERVDSGRSDIPLWIVATNMDVLEDAFPTGEELDVMTRRSVNINFYFRQKYWLGIWGTSYSKDDVKGCSPDEIDKYVTYVVEEPGKKACTMTNFGLIEWISKHELSRVACSIATSLNVKTELEYQTMASVPMSSDDFIRLMNTPGTLQTAIGKLLSGTFTSKIYTKFELGRKIMKTFKSMIHVAGSYFSDMDSFILCGLNGGFFKNFHGSNYVLAFTDKAYYIETVGDHLDAGLYVTNCYTPEDLAQQVGATMQGLTNLDFLAVGMANLPPWFMLAGDILAIIFKMGFTFGSIASSISDNTALFRAIQMENVVTEAKDKYLDKAVEGVGDKFATIVNPAYGETPSFSFGGAKYEPAFETPSDPDSKKSTNTKSGKKRGGRGGGKKHEWKFAKGVAQADVTKEPIDEITHFINDNLVVDAKQEMMIDPSMPITVKAIAKNCVEIVSGSGSRLVYGLMIHDRIGTTVNHVTMQHDSNDLYIRTVDGITSKLKVIKQDEVTDCMDFEVGDKCPAFKNITAHLIPGSSSNLEDALAVLVTVTRDHDFGPMPCLQMRYYRINAMKQLKIDEKYFVSLRSYVGNVVGFGITPPIETRAGDCGSVLIVCDPKRPQKVIGLHAAANTTQGFARPLTREMFIDSAKLESLVLPTAMGEFVPFQHENDPFGNPVVAKCKNPPYKPKKN
jgi:hypothetical protein